MTRPPADLALDEEEKLFYGALGKAITQWQRVEEGLALIFSMAVSNNREMGVSANAAFHAVLNFNSKLAMTASALEMIAFHSVFDRQPGTENPMLAEWSPLNNRARRRADRRNDLAHFAMHLDDTRNPGYRWYLSPNIIDMRALIRHGGKPPERHACMIMAQGNSFEKLGTDLILFCLKWFPLATPVRPAASP